MSNEQERPWPSMLSNVVVGGCIGFSLAALIFSLCGRSKDVNVCLSGDDVWLSDSTGINVYLRIKDGVLIAEDKRSQICVKAQDNGWMVVKLGTLSDLLGGGYENKPAK